MSKGKRLTLYGLFIWGLAVLFFFYEFFLRVLPATVSSEIIASFEINLEQFAMIASAYYLTYAFMQIPVGLLLDRFPVRLLVTAAIALCAFGTLWFAFAQGFVAAYVARLFIGMGSSFGFVALMIVTLNWFPKKYFAFMLGWGQFLGAIGPLVAGGPVALAMSATGGDWRKIFLYVAGFGILLTLLIGLLIRGKPSSKSSVIFVDRKEPLKVRLKLLFQKSQFWWILLYAGTVYVAMPLLGAFWGTAYLKTRGFSQAAAASIISMIWVGLAVGSPILGRLSDQFRRRSPFIILCAAVGVIGSFLVLYTPSINPFFLGFLFFLIGIGGAGQNISFALVAENSPKSLRATALAMNNTALTGFAAIVPPFVTSIIQHYSPGDHLTEMAFERGLLVLPLCFFIALLIAVFGIRETYCRQQTEIHHVH